MYCLLPSTHPSRRQNVWSTIVKCVCMACSRNVATFRGNAAAAAVSASHSLLLLCHWVRRNVHISGLASLNFFRIVSLSAEHAVCFVLPRALHCYLVIEVISACFNTNTTWFQISTERIRLNFNTLEDTFLKT